MSSKRGPGRFVAAHQTEAARRSLIQPVPCWEYKWVVPQGMPTSSTLRLRQWVKTDKRQEFSDDEDESQVPLAPLPDEPDQDEVDQEEEEEEKEEKEDSVRVPSGMETPLPAETSMRGVPGLDTPVSGSMTPASGELPAAVSLKLDKLGAAAAASSASASKPHPLASSFVPEDMESSEMTENAVKDQVGGNIGDIGTMGDIGDMGDMGDMGDIGDIGDIGDMGDMMDTETGLMDSALDGMNMDLGVGMDDTGGFMDMLNTGDLDLGDDLGDDLLSGNMGGQS